MEREPNGLIRVPSVEVQTYTGKLVLTWLNTTIRLFGEEMCNHIEYIDETGQACGLSDDQELMDELFEKGFPVKSLPTIALDPVSQEWFIAKESIDIANLETEGLPVDFS